MSKSQRHRAGHKTQEESCIAATPNLTSEEEVAFEEARQQAVTSDGSGEARRKKVLEILADCEPEYCVGFLSGLISATVRKHWPAQHHQRIADDIGRGLKFMLSMSGQSSELRS